MLNKIAIIGSGFSGLAAACYLAKEGKEVTVYEKNASVGGRARIISAKGYTFDMGPSWYWMPDVFEKFFADFGKKVSDYYELVQLDPAFRMVFEDSEIDVPSSPAALEELFESIEPGSGVKLRQFLAEAKTKYEISMKDIIYFPCHSMLEFVKAPIIASSLKLNLFQSYHHYVRKYFKDERLISLMEFPVLFLGAMPKDTPALYSIMNYTGLEVGTFYPMGGMHKIVEAMHALALELGVKFETNAEVEEITISANKATGLKTAQQNYSADAVISGADYHHTDQRLLPVNRRQYSEKYWDKRTMAPSAILYYLGVNRKISKVLHHTLFFDTSFAKHTDEIYTKPDWPKEPLFYISCPSKTDNSVAPEGKENLIILIPIAAGLPENTEIAEVYFHKIMDRLEKYVGHNIRSHIEYRRDYTSTDFVSDYNSFKGNAYGLANSLMQTAFLKPKLRHKNISNLYFCGQLTVPGPGVPPALISGKIAATELMKTF